MKLFTKEILKKLPKEISERAKIEDLTLQCKLFTPWGNWTWYIAAYNPETGLAFGYVEGFENEWGYVDVEELAAIKGPFGLKVERDIHFVACKFNELKISARRA